MFLKGGGRLIFLTAAQLRLFLMWFNKTAFFQGQEMAVSGDIMANLTLSIAVGDYDRNRALFDGRVQIDGVDPVFMKLSPEEIFFRAFRTQDFDICELSFSSYTVSTAQGSGHYIAIPAFLSRSFRHSSIYIRKGKGIGTPEDLRGKRIGIAEYQLTANVWARALLEDDYGVKPSEIQWVRGGVGTPDRPEKIKLQLPDDVSIEVAPKGRSLDNMLVAGDLDGFIGPRNPPCYDEGNPDIVRLFPDLVGTATAYYRRTGIFPIMHLLGLRKSLAESHPWLPGALFKAFNASKNHAVDQLLDTAASHATIPFLAEHIEAAQALLGQDYWSYGIEKNRAVLDNFLDHHHRQGLSSRRVTVDELFHQGSREQFSV